MRGGGRSEGAGPQTHTEKEAVSVLAGSRPPSVIDQSSGSSSRRVSM